MTLVSGADDFLLRRLKCTFGTFASYSDPGDPHGSVWTVTSQKETSGKRHLEEPISTERWFLVRNFIGILKSLFARKRLGSTNSTSLELGPRSYKPIYKCVHEGSQCFGADGQPVSLTGRPKGKGREALRWEPGGFDQIRFFGAKVNFFGDTKLKFLTPFFCLYCFLVSGNSGTPRHRADTNDKSDRPAVRGPQGITIPADAAH